MKPIKENNKNAGDGKLSKPSPDTSVDPDNKAKQPKEYGGRKDGLDPTRYGDWEKNGRCIDF